MTGSGLFDPDFPFDPDFESGEMVPDERSVRMSLEDELKQAKLKAEAERIELQRQVDAAKLKKELSSLQEPGNEVREVRSNVALVNWSGTQIDLGRWILQAYGNGNIEAETARQALTQTAVHFQKDGRAVNVKSLDAELYKQGLYKPAEERRRNLRIE